MTKSKARKKQSPAKTFQAKCVMCGKRFPTKRNHAKTCGTKCRVDLHNKKRFARTVKRFELTCFNCGKGVDPLKEQVYAYDHPDQVEMLGVNPTYWCLKCYKLQQELK